MIKGKKGSKKETERIHVEARRKRVREHKGYAILLEALRRRAARA